jgi:hypothetical protein
MRLSMKRALAGAASLAVVASVAPFISPGVAGAATNLGTLTINPTSGDSSSYFGFTFPNTPQCPGDTAGAGYNWSTFMVPTGTDLNTLSFNSLGPTQVAGEYRASFLSAGAGDPQVMKPTGIAGGPGQPGIISGIPQFSFEYFVPGEIPAGTYSVGVACTSAGGTLTETYWSQDMTVTANAAGGPAEITWVQGLPAEAPAAPVVNAPGAGASAVGNGQITVDVDPAATGGEPTSYDVTVIDGATTVDSRNVVSADPGGETFTGLTNGTTYTVTATATNAEGTSVASAGVDFTPSVVHASPVVTASPGTGVGTVDVVWTAAGGSPTSYDVTISPAPTTGPATQNVLAAGPLTATFANLGSGVHTVTVTPLGYPAGESALAGSDTATPTSGDGTPATLIQTIQVSREQVNAIIFEQDCDGEAGPAAYGTDTCVVDLGAAALDGAGEYYEADGELWPIRVIDHRDTDKGWTVTGVIDAEFVDGVKTFDANALGWDPKEIFQSAPLANGYTMTVDEGAVVAPWSADQALKNGSILMQTVPDAGVQRGLGTAVYSADLTIKIPISVASGDYSADITFTLVNKTP